MKRKTEGWTYTKKVVFWLLLIGVINGTMPFILSWFGRDPVSDMGIAWVTEIVGVSCGYFLKAYFGKKSERRQDLEDYINTRDNLGYEDFEEKEDEEL